MGQAVEGLFGPQAIGGPAAPEAVGGRPRLRCADRRQAVMRCATLDECLPEDHRARLVWTYVEGLDLGRLYQKVKAVEGHAGHPPIDPKILLALWLYATLDGVGAAREIDRLCDEHQAYQWICGGVSVNYHTLADFRTQPVEVLDQLLTDSVAALMHEGLVTLERIAQDGVRVRASAGAASFRRRPTLEECQAQAQEQVRVLREEVAADPAAAAARQRGARQRAAQERAGRLGQALAEMAELERKRQAQAPKAPPAPPASPSPDESDRGPGGSPASKPAGPKPPAPPRVSTTDPEARVMKMADGGYRPAFNVQYATDTASQVVTGVAVSNSPSDQGQMAPMVGQHAGRYGQRPAAVLVDGGFVTLADIEKVGAAPQAVAVYAPVPEPRKAGQDRYQRRKDDSDLIAAWRQRMGSEAAKAIYKERAATAECVNALARGRGLYRFLVRGLSKARAVALWFALAHNLMRAVTLRAQAAQAVPVAV